MMLADLYRLPVPPALTKYPLGPDGIPRKDFGNRVGWRFEPIVPIYYLNSYIDIWLREGIADYLQAARLMADFLISQAEPISDRAPRARALWTRSPLPPFYWSDRWSVMTAGRAGEALMRLARHTGEEAYHQAALEFFAALATPVERGGCVFHEAGKIWFTGDLKAAPRYRTLNDHGSIMVSLWSWLQATGDQQAQRLYEAAVSSFAAMLPAFERVDGLPGSRVNLSCPGWLRIRVAGTDKTPLIAAAHICHPEGTATKIDLTRDHDDGWELSHEGLSHPGDNTRRVDEKGREILPREVIGADGSPRRTYALLVRVGFSAWPAIGREIRIWVRAYMPAGAMIAADIYPGVDGRYVFGAARPARTGWADYSWTFDVDGMRLEPKSTDGEDHYHHLNTSYVEFVAAEHPSFDLDATAQRWRAWSARPPEENWVRWFSEERVERRWTASGEQVAGM